MLVKHIIFSLVLFLLHIMSKMAIYIEKSDMNLLIFMNDPKVSRYYICLSFWVVYKNKSKEPLGLQLYSEYDSMRYNISILLSHSMKIIGQYIID